MVRSGVTSHLTSPASTDRDAADGHGATTAPLPSYARHDLLAAIRALAPRLRESTDEIERRRTLTEPLVQAMVDAGLYRMLLPRSLGGGEIDPLTYFDVVEALARVESAAAWSVLISTSTMTGTVRALTDDQIRAMFTTPRRAIMAGSAPPKGRAVQFNAWTHVAHAAVGLGIARVAIEEFVRLAGGKQATWMPAEGRLAGRTTVQAKVAQAEALVGAGRAYVVESTRDAWETIGRGERLSPQQRAVYRLSIVHAMDSALQAIDLMYSLGGATAIYAASRLDRCLRDARTAAAHVWVAPDTYELAGRLLLGVDPGSPTI
jgi:alkylation response protein AidB-like acyl-CoA dehydrogenase